MCLKGQVLPTILTGCDSGRQTLELVEALSTQVIKDARQHLGDLLALGVARHSKGVGVEGRLHLGVVEVDD